MGEETTSVKKYAAELIGTFALVFVGCGSAVIAGQYIGFLGISFAFGLTVLVMVYAIGHISGCHINPAITIAMLVGGKIKAKDAVFYIACDGLGQNGYGLESPGGYSLIACFAAEVVLTALFLFVIFGSTSKKAPPGFAGISIGLSLVLIHIVGIPITGTSVNPARSLGPALFVGGEAITQLWLFWVAPIIGGIIAAVIWRFGFDEK
jgi:aquaporin Z